MCVRCKDSLIPDYGTYTWMSACTLTNMHTYILHIHIHTHTLADQWCSQLPGTWSRLGLHRWPWVSHHQDSCSARSLSLLKVPSVLVWAAGIQPSWHHDNTWGESASPWQWNGMFVCQNQVSSFCWSSVTIPKWTTYDHWSLLPTCHVQRVGTVADIGQAWASPTLVVVKWCKSVAPHL